MYFGCRLFFINLFKTKKMENLQNAIIEGALAQMLNDAIASINYKSENERLNYNYEQTTSN
jgi:hypothetical protein